MIVQRNHLATQTLREAILSVMLAYSGLGLPKNAIPVGFYSL
jgi:hypothetical protein